MIGAHSENKVSLPYPHLGQRLVRVEAKRHNWLVAGRRWRKTTTFMAIAVEAALKGQLVLWGAPTYDQVRIGWDEAKRAAGGVASFRQTSLTAIFPGGGAIVYRSLDTPDNARGHTAHGVIIDEGADVSPLAWYQVLRPMLMDTGGWSWIGGTPRGRNWFWREADQSAPDSVTWQAPTLGCAIVEGKLVRAPHRLENPNIPFEELQKMFATMPEQTFRQEVMAEIVEEAGGVIRMVREAATATAQESRYLDPVTRKQHSYVIGADWGQTSDFSVFSVMDVQTKEQVCQERSNHVDYIIQEARLVALCARFKPSLVIAEANAMGGPIIERLGNAGLPMYAWTASNATKASVIQDLALAFEQHAIRILPNEQLIAELQSYQMTRTASGLPHYSAPEGVHDDCVIALALAWWGAKQAQTEAPYTYGFAGQKPKKGVWSW